MLRKDFTMSARLSVLIVDDNRTSLALMDMLVRKLPDCTTQLQSDAQVLLANLGRLDYDIAVIASRMAPLDGIALARRLKEDPRFRDKPILLTADDPDAGLRERAAAAGIAEVLGKPISPVDFRARVQGLARPRSAGSSDAGWNDPVAAASRLSPREEEYLVTLVKVAGCRDRESPLHSQRMAHYCAILAHNLGLPEAYCNDIRHAAPLHDIGKAGLSDMLLRKSGVLSPEERREMEEHTRIGHAMLKGSRSQVFRMAAEIALTHHERWDGSGYPQRLRAEQIPLSGRIAAVADVFDALTSVRAYKTAWSIANAFAYLHDNAGEQFDPACVAAFESAREEIVAVMRAMPDPDDSTADAA
jgi:putative two-component system response regulator